MLRQYLRRRRKILRGFLRARLGRALPYDPGSWWDRAFYRAGVSDRQTISAEKEPLAARYHYASVELSILRLLGRSRAAIRGARVLDLGAGAGHWIDFYRALGAERCVGVDVSARAAAFLSKKYSADEDVEIVEGVFQDRLAGSAERFDLINAVGVMFHLVEDAEWERGLRAIAGALREGGTLVASGHFGWLDGVDAQIDAQGRVNKRLRSARHWKRTLRALGFESIRIRRNPAWLFFDEPLPESSVLVATRRVSAP